MKASRKLAIGVAAGLSLGLAAASVGAQPSGYGGSGMGPGFGPGHGRMGGGFGPRAGFSDPAAAVEGRIAAMKTELKIGAQQENAWNAYAQALRDQSQAMQAWRNSRAASATALERSDAFASHLRERAQGVEKANAAFKDLYAALSPEQKAIADQRMGPRMAAGYGRGPGMRWR